MNRVCLLPQDLIAWMFDSGLPDSVCSLFLRFPVTSSLDRYSFVEYLVKLLSVVIIDWAILLGIFKMLSLRINIKRTLEVNLITHPVVFFFMPIIGSSANLAIGTMLLINVFLLLSLKTLYLRRKALSTRGQALLFGISSVVITWYSGAVISL